MTYAEFNTLKEEVISEVRNIIFSYWGEPINSVTLYDGIGNRIYLTQLEFIINMYVFHLMNIFVLCLMEWKVKCIYMKLR